MTEYAVHQPDGKLVARTDVSTLAHKKLRQAGPGAAILSSTSILAWHMGTTGKQRERAREVYERILAGGRPATPIAPAAAEQVPRLEVAVAAATTATTPSALPVESAPPPPEPAATTTSTAETGGAPEVEVARARAADRLNKLLAPGGAEPETVMPTQTEAEGQCAWPEPCQNEVTPMRRHAVHVGLAPYCNLHRQKIRANRGRVAGTDLNVYDEASAPAPEKRAHAPVAAKQVKPPVAASAPSPVAPPNFRAVPGEVTAGDLAVCYWTVRDAGGIEPLRELLSTVEGMGGLDVVKAFAEALRRVRGNREG